MKKPKIHRFVSLLLTALLFFGTAAQTAYAEPEDAAAADVPSEDAADVLLSDDGDSSAGVVVAADDAKVTITVSGVGSSGTASVLRFEANEYHRADPLHGLSAKTAAEGAAVGTYTCGTAQTFEISRCRDDGTDNLFSKYYVVQGETILAGPVYATEIASPRDIRPFAVTTKKGLAHEDGSTPAVAAEMGTSNTVINVDMGTLIYRNEDENGSPVDNSGRGNVRPFVSNGETFYLDGNYIAGLDHEVAAYTKLGINVSLIIIAWKTTDFTRYPSSLAFTRDNRETMAFNTSNERGLKYWIAAMEFLGDHYSQDSSIGYVSKYIIGNEIDYSYDWNRIVDPPTYVENGKTYYNWVDLDTYMEEYARTMRTAHLAVKKYNAGARVSISLTHSWALSRRQSFVNERTNTSIAWNSYAPKEMLDWMNTIEKGRGDYDWTLAVHPYPLGTTSSNPVDSDLYPQQYGLKPTTGDWRTTPWITSINLELYQQYLEQPAARYNGQIREVALTETSICTADRSAVSEEEYQTSLKQQAASIAQYYYRAACVPCITEIVYFEPHDQGTYLLGLMDADGNKKPSYDVWKYVDTNLTFAYANPYLPSISSTAKSYYDIMDLTHSGYDWPAMWTEENIVRRQVTPTETILQTDKDSYAVGEDIVVIAVSDGPDAWVGLYRSTDSYGDGSTAPIYRYSLNDESRGIVPGKPVTLQTAESSDPPAVLEGGTYKVCLFGDSGTGTVLAEKEITVKAAVSGVTRVAGGDRFETSLMTAEALKKALGVEKFDNIILSSGLNFADALAGSYLSYVKNAPIIVTAEKFGKTTPYVTINSYVRENLAAGGTVYILGSENAVSAKAIADLSGLQVKRLGGSDRFATNIEILKEAGVKAGDDVLVATGKNFADSLSASAAGKPILLVSSSLKDPQKEYLKSLSGSRFMILGAEAAVSRTVQNELAAYGTVTRIAGANRYETSVLIAEAYFGNPPAAVLAYSLNFPDGLCGGPLASAMNAPLILTKTGSETIASDYCAKKNVTAGAVLGAASLISNEAAGQIFRCDPAAIK